MNTNIQFLFPTDKSLKPWNAADEYLINLAQEYNISGSNILILNDSHGFLSVNLSEANLTVYTDSFQNLTCIKKNLSDNSVTNEINFINNFNENHNEVFFDYVFLKIPKSVNQLKFLIQSIKPYLKKDCILLSSGMTKHLSNNTRDILTDEFGETDITKVYKKAISFISKYQVHEKTESDFVSKFYNEDFGLTLYSLPNVFSSGSLDLGTRFLLENIKTVSGKVLDLGCGSGAIGLFCKQLNKEISLTMLDDSYQAISSSKLSLNDVSENTSFVWDYSLNILEKNSFDFVISNPPFHNEATVDMNIGLKLFRQVKTVLKKKGEFILVYNKTLSYEPHLKKLFYKIEKLAENKKFIVLRCIN